MNPHNSPWNKPSPQLVQDKQLYWRWSPIKIHLSRSVPIQEYRGILRIDKDIFIAKHSSKFRIRSHLDWAWYTPKTLAQAINNNTVDQYYEIMLADVRSDPNEWKDLDFEQELKSFYAARVGRCSIV